MDVTEAVTRRKSIRAFLPDPVSDEKIAELLTTASRSPSGGNVQPWRIYVVNGASMQRFREFLSTRQPGPPAYDIYPPSLPEPYRSSRYKIGEDMYASIGVTREDKAPAAIFCFVDRIMGPPQWSDLGMFLQTFMLLAQEAGLDTCPQEAWAVHEEAVAEFVGAPDGQQIFCGVALGTADEDAPINSVQSEREPLDVFATFV
jgi:nitroreductase